MIDDGIMLLLNRKSQRFHSLLLLRYVHVCSRIDFSNHHTQNNKPKVMYCITFDYERKSLFIVKVLLNIVRKTKFDFQF